MPCIVHHDFKIKVSACGKILKLNGFISVVQENHVITWFLYFFEPIIIASSFVYMKIVILMPGNGKKCVSPQISDCSPSNYKIQESL